MKPINIPLRPAGLVFMAALFALVFLSPGSAQAQSSPPQRVIRTYVPPDQLVSFLPSTPFPQFVEFLSPIFKRVTGKQIVDPESRAEPINIAISGMHFLDAFELVLEYQGLTYRETDQFFIVEPVVVAPGEAVSAGGTAAASAGAATPVLATLDSREIKINAILFDLNLSRAREVGLDWNGLFGEEVELEAKEGEILVDLGRYVGRNSGPLTIPASIPFRTLTQTLRALESDGLGRTVANPTVTVQSGQSGNIQIGSDVPVQTRDFAGNTVTQFFKTGTIIEVLPTLITESPDGDTASGDLLDFIHMDVRVEKSNSRPSTAGLIIDRNQADTKVLLLPGEQTVIGGLVSTDEVITRRGVPVLKDLPGWFFGLRYIFGHNSRTTIQRELLIVLQAEVLDPLGERAERPFDNELLEKRRREAKENIRRVEEGAGAKADLPPFSTAKPGGRQ